MGRRVCAIVMALLASAGTFATAFAPGAQAQTAIGPAQLSWDWLPQEMRDIIQVSAEAAPTIHEPRAGNPVGFVPWTPSEATLAALYAELESAALESALTESGSPLVKAAAAHVLQTRFGVPGHMLEDLGPMWETLLTDASDAVARMVFNAGQNNPANQTPTSSSQSSPLGPEFDPILAMIFDDCQSRIPGVDEFQPRLQMITCAATFPVVLVVLVVVAAVVVAWFVLQLVIQVDANADGLGDEWANAWKKRISQIVQAGQDLDQDGLNNVGEFRWQLVPACLASVVTNCQDRDADGWLDGSETTYWNDSSNDNERDLNNQVLYDPDRFDDGDGLRNVVDADSDNDGLQDGAEHETYATYPEFQDSDCLPSATACTPSNQATRTASRTGSPGTGDGLNDSMELAHWNAITPTAWRTNYDGDGIPNNLLDSDADGDEALALGTSMARFDTDHDGLLDGQNLFILAADSRHGIFTAAGITYLDLQGGRLFRGEESSGTGSLDWDSDDDGEPTFTQAGYEPILDSGVP